MYITAHRVVHPRTTDEGINAFCYRHGSFIWVGLPPAGIPDDNPGELAVSMVAVPPGGNRVRSYFDIIMPDEVMWGEARRSFITFLSEAQGRDFPWEGVSGRCTFRVGLGCLVHVGGVLPAPRCGGSDFVRCDDPARACSKRRRGFGCASWCCRCCLGRGGRSCFVCWVLGERSWVRYKNFECFRRTHGRFGSRDRGW